MPFSFCVPENDRQLKSRAVVESTQVGVDRLGLSAVLGSVGGKS